jgi:hypothetical protein
MLPTTAASVADGIMAFMNAAFGLRLVAVFFAAFFGAAFFADAFFAGFFAAVFFAADFFAAGFLAGFFAFLAVAIVLLPVG